MQIYIAGEVTHIICSISYHEEMGGRDIDFGHNFFKVLFNFGAKFRENDMLYTPLSIKFPLK